MLDLAWADTGVHTITVRLASVLGEQVLADEIPVTAAALAGDDDNNVPERFTFSVPRVDGTVSWAPTTAGAALACDGQEILLQLIVDGEVLDRGVYVLAAAETNGQDIACEAQSLTALLDEARLISPYTPAAGRTFTQVARDLVGGAMPVDTTTGPAPTDRAVPSTLVFEDSRLTAVAALLDAWPADSRVSADGTLVITSATPSTTPVITLDGYVVGAPVTRTTRDGGYNVVVARGRDSTGQPIQSTAAITTGDRALGGPFSPLPVPYFFESPLLTTLAQCASAAATIAARKARRSGRQWTVTTVPLPHLELGDVVSLAGLTARVESIQLPLLPVGAMTLTLAEVT